MIEFHMELKYGVLLKKQLVGSYRKVLSIRIGCIYTKVEENYFTYLDTDNVDLGEEAEFLDKNGVLIMVRYIDKLDTFSIPRSMLIVYFRYSNS